MRFFVRLFVGIVVCLGILASCAGPRGGQVPSTQPVDSDGPPSRTVDVASIPEPVPKPEPRSRYGNRDSYVVLGKRYHTLDSGEGYIERGIASWYGSKFHGRPTSSQEPFDMYKVTAAHRTLPLPTYAQVTNLENGRSIIVRINDRGPFHGNRLIDLSWAAAEKLDVVSQGTALVEVRALDPDHPQVKPAPPAKDARIYLQVGAFATQRNATLLQRRLRNLGLTPVQVSEVDWGRGPLHRVRIGPMGSVTRADRASARLEDEGFGTPLVIIE